MKRQDSMLPFGTQISVLEKLRVINEFTGISILINLSIQMTGIESNRMQKLRFVFDQAESKETLYSSINYSLLSTKQKLSTFKFKLFITLILYNQSKYLSLSINTPCTYRCQNILCIYQYLFLYFYFLSTYNSFQI